MKLRFLALTLVLAGTLAAEEIWRVDNLAKIGGHAVTVAGAPRVIEESGAKALGFDGVKDGVFLSALPLAGAKAFTIEVLFRPDAGGPKEQRFVHLEDAAGARAMIETRVDGQRWWLDTFLLSAGGGPRRTLIDPKFAHPTGRWHWAALRYDGKTMTSYVDGQKELEGEIALAPFVAGKASLGVRQNKVSWFKGAIREVRFHSEALAPEKLQKAN